MPQSPEYSGGSFVAFLAVHLAVSCYHSFRSLCFCSGSTTMKCLGIQPNRIILVSCLSQLHCCGQHPACLFAFSPDAIPMHSIFNQTQALQEDPGGRGERPPRDRRRVTVVPEPRQSTVGTVEGCFVICSRRGMLISSRKGRNGSVGRAHFSVGPIESFSAVLGNDPYVTLGSVQNLCTRVFDD